jgi:hypothetical protein
MDRSLQTEHLEAHNIIELEYSSHWAPKVYDRDREVGTYVDKWICRSTIEMSRPGANTATGATASPSRLGRVRERGLRLAPVPGPRLLIFGGIGTPAVCQKGRRGRFVKASLVLAWSAAAATDAEAAERV